MRGRPRKTRVDTAEFFEANVLKTTSHWIWTGKVDDLGRMRIRDKGWQTTARRYVYQRFIGMIPRKHVIKAVCGHPRCVMPGHLKAVSRRKGFDALRDAWITRELERIFCYGDVYDLQMANQDADCLASTPCCDQ